MTLKEAIHKKVLILDGAMGTMLQKQGFTGNFDMLNLTNPDAVSSIYQQYLEAGADIITTNTFSSQRISQAEYGTESQVRELNLSGARMARELADSYTKKNPERPRFVIGTIGPTNRSLSISPDINNPALRNITFNELADAYEEQIRALRDGGVDAILIETIFDTLNAKAAIFSYEKVKSEFLECKESNWEACSEDTFPLLMLSLTVSDKSGRTLSGQTIKAFLASVSHADIFSVGLNCSFGASELKPFLRELSSHAPYHISCHPNAGLPNALGQYDQTTDEFANEVIEFIDEGLVNIIGGCCGTTPEHIKMLSDIVEGKLEKNVQMKPLNSQLANQQLKEVNSKLPSLIHQPSSANSQSTLTLSGLEPLYLTPEVRFVNIGERCNVAGSRKFLRLINEKNYDEALQIARKQVEDGAMVLDINMDDGLLDAQTEMVNFVNLIMSDPDIARVPLMIDSSDWNVIQAGMRCIQGKCIVNSLSLKEGEEAFISKALEVKRLGAALVVMAFDENGQATSYEHKTQICQRAYKLLTKIGFNPNDIIFDPCVLAVGTGIETHNNYAINFINATEWIKQNLPGAHVSGGVSNLSFAFRGNNYLREAMHAVFLYHNIQRGMDMSIVNPSSKVTYDEIPKAMLEALEDLLFNRRADATERLMTLGQVPVTTSQEMHQSLSSTPHPLSSEERLQQMVMKGTTEDLETIVLAEMERLGSAANVIEGPLMTAMNKVGILFGEGKMFLPQVVKTARTMKQAVEILTPYMEKSKPSTQESTSTTQNRHQPTLVLATVKGDVHDIGKNIVGVVMGCNGYQIEDLGVMVSAETIVAKVKETGADLIGLSGLITPSLTEMVNITKALQQVGINIPLMIGGATTSDMHTALKIAPEYEGPVVWMKDAAQNVLAAGQLLDPAQAPAYITQLREHQAELRASYTNSKPQLLSLEEARKRKPKTKK